MEIWLREKNKNTKVKPHKPSLVLKQSIILILLKEKRILQKYDKVTEAEESPESNST